MEGKGKDSAHRQLHVEPRPGQEKWAAGSLALTRRTLGLISGTRAATSVIQLLWVQRTSWALQSLFTSFALALYLVWVILFFVLSDLQL